jgi:hypothetical protein
VRIQPQFFLYHTEPQENQLIHAAITKRGIKTVMDFSVG